MIIYRKKFKNNVKNKFIYYNDNIENMKNFIKISIEFDDKLYEKIMKKYYVQSSYCDESSSDSLTYI